jgi:hypothetical protein
VELYPMSILESQNEIARTFPVLWLVEVSKVSNHH